MARLQFLHDIGRNLRFLLRSDASQNGEQALLLAALPQRGLFLEVGAGHPVALSNTWALWRRGWRGTSYDAQAHLRTLWRLFRPGSDFHAVAVLDSDTEVANLHRFAGQWWGMSTLMADRASVVHGSIGVEAEQVTVPATSILSAWKRFVAEYGRAPDLLHLDVEGLDVRLLIRLLRCLGTDELPQFIIIELLAGRSMPAEVFEKYDEVGRVASAVLLSARAAHQSIELTPGTQDLA